MEKHFCISFLLVICGPSVTPRTHLGKNLENVDVGLFPALMSTTGDMEKGVSDQDQDVFRYLLDVELQVKLGYLCNK